MECWNHGNYTQPTSGAALSTPEQAKLADILFFDLDGDEALLIIDLSIGGPVSAASLIAVAGLDSCKRP
jgi:hypothetical protein